MKNKQHPLKLKVNPNNLSWKLGQAERQALAKLFEIYKTKPAANTLEYLAKLSLDKPINLKKSQFKLDKKDCLLFHVFVCKASFWLTDAGLELAMLQLMLSDIDKFVGVEIRREIETSQI